MDIAIFGAGVGGLTSAISLTAQGHSCHVYEHSDQSMRSGMGFILMPDGSDCLRRLGVDLTGAPLHRFTKRDASGVVLNDKPMPAGARGVGRCATLERLKQALPDGTLTVGARLDHLDFDVSRQVSVAHLCNGGQVKADLYVAADGIRSQARKQLFPERALPVARVLEVVGFVECADVASWARYALNKFHAPEGGLAFGILPVGDTQLVWYMQFDRRRYPAPAASPQARRAFVNHLVGDWADPIPYLLSITDFSSVHFWHPVDTDLVPQFHQGNLVMVGDAAHPFLPFSSQGVSSAIADTASLASHMLRNHALAKALSAYSVERRAQCLPYIAQGRALTQLFLAPQVLGDATIPVAH